VGGWEESADHCGEVEGHSVRERERGETRERDWGEQLFKQGFRVGREQLKKIGNLTKEEK
jgi:hypothetical protein